MDQFTTRQAEQEAGTGSCSDRSIPASTSLSASSIPPGLRLAATDVDVLKKLLLPAARVTALLNTADLLEDDCIPATTSWAHQHIDRLPAAMTHEMHTWLTVMRDGSTTPPRGRPRSETTIRLSLYWSLPDLTRWANVGKATLREITARDIAAVLPTTDRDCVQTCRGLRSVFGLLATRHLIFTDLTTRLRTGPRGLTGYRHYPHALTLLHSHPLAG